MELSRGSAALVMVLAVVATTAAAAYVVLPWAAGTPKTARAHWSPMCDYHPFNITVPPGEDWNKAANTVDKSVHRHWGSYVEENETTGERNNVVLGVKALRVSPPGPPHDPETDPADGGSPDNTYVDWDRYAADERPKIVHDLLCLSRWQVENIPTMTERPFWTMTASADWVFDDAMDALEAERFRQWGEPDPWCGDDAFQTCFMLFEGEYYGAEEIRTHEDSFSPPDQDVEENATEPPLTVHTVDIGNTTGRVGPLSEYAPATVEIAAGDAVRWVNLDPVDMTHTAAADAGAPDGFDTGDVGPGNTSDTIVFEETGTYAYRCAYHPDTMQGEIVVTDGGSTERADPGPPGPGGQGDAGGA